MMYVGYAAGGIIICSVLGVAIPLAFALTDPSADTIWPFGIYFGPLLGAFVGVMLASRRLRREQ